MKNYQEALQYIKDNGVEIADRTGTGTIAVAGMQLRYDLSKGFPAVTTKTLAWKAVVTELMWFLRGSTDNRQLAAMVHDGNATGNTIWTKNANDPKFTQRAYDGDLGPVYGYQWRFWPADGSEMKSVSIRPAEDYTKLVKPAKGFTPKADPEHRKIHSLWMQIMNEVAGGSTVSISTEWQDYEKFKNSIVHVPGFYRFLNDSMFTLDPHYFGAAQYSKSTAIFVRADKKSIILDLTDSSMNTATSLWRPVWYVDQIQELIDGLKNDPYSRRHILSAWNVSDLPKMALPPCHVMANFVVLGNKLTCILTQRSCDMFLGVPFNIASYSLLTHLLAKETGLEVGEFVWNGGNCHIYNDHLAQVDTQLEREPYELPTLNIKTDKSIFEYEFQDFELMNYQHHPAIKGNMSV